MRTDLMTFLFDWDLSTEKKIFITLMHIASSAFTSPPPPPRGGGGTSILKVTGTCRWTGYDFAVINIGTGYLAALLRSSILAQGILRPSCRHQYWHRVSKSATGGLLRLSQGCFPGLPSRVPSPQCL